MPAIHHEPSTRSGRRLLVLALLTLLHRTVTAQSPVVVQDDPPRAWSGIYPHLAMFNDENECGTGAVVPWAGRLWAITYAPHRPRGSTDKLYEIDSALRQTVRPESVGGTPACRMIHRESQQLLIGPYVIATDGTVRVIPPSRMPGRLTGVARHLVHPAEKVYYATMEEGFYEVDVRTLEVRELHPDANASGDLGGDLLPGYHGKGLFSTQGRLVYANNGENSAEARRRPDVPSGCLAEWDGSAWRVVRRNQFTEVTGPGGIWGNASDEEPLWSIGWDHRSLILMLLDAGRWHAFRLPKASHSYDGAHGWNTEWPRIRDIGEDDLLMTMHGMFWRFPRGFSASSSAGIEPRSTYLKVIGDFCRWGDRLVLGCDDTARAEFLNRRQAKGALVGPGQSQSNLWFIEPARLDRLGPPVGRGAVWLRDRVAAGEPSDPFLFSGFEHRAVHLLHDSTEAVEFTLEVDEEGQGRWRRLRTARVAPGGYSFIAFETEERGAWVRVRVDRDLRRATALFTGVDSDGRTPVADAIFAGLASPSTTRATGGLVRARGDDLRTLHLAASIFEGGEHREAGYYELDVDMRLRRVEDPAAERWLRANAAIPTGVLEADAASVLYVDEEGRRFRLPRGLEALDQAGPFGPERIDREVATERDLFNAQGILYELPAQNAGGFAKIRPISTHGRRLHDFCSWRGLLVLTGLELEGAEDNPHVIRSDDGRAAVWVGAVDDLWRLGKPRGHGGPWKDVEVRAGDSSDPYLLTGFDRKSISLSHRSDHAVTFAVEVDVSGDGLWAPWRSFEVDAGATATYRFPDAFQAYWLRVKADRDTTATVWLVYE